jgi:sec-independent protein translocase protein TatC
MAESTSALRRITRAAGAAASSRRRTVPTVDDSRMSLIEHLKELRKRLLIAFLAVSLLSLIVGIWGYHGVFELLRRPYCNVPVNRRTGGAGCDLIFTHPTDAFFIRLKVSLVAGTILASPVWLYQLWAFITPGLHRNERRWGTAFVFSSVLLFAAGCVLSYVVLGPALDVLLGFAGNGVVALLEVNQYISFVMSMLVIFGVSFEFPLVLILLNLSGVLSAARLRKWRRAAIFLIFVFAGFATPTQDPFSMLALAAPLCLLYEVAMAVARQNDKRRARAAAEDGFGDLSDDEASPAPPTSSQLAGTDADRRFDQREFDDTPAATVGSSSHWDDDAT